MFDVASFLMRWLFVCNMIRDIAERQTLPAQPYTPPATIIDNTPIDPEEVWKDDCVRVILSCPPGRQRYLVLDALRIELVQNFSKILIDADAVLRKYYCRRRRKFIEHELLNGTQNNVVETYLDADIEIMKAFNLEASEPVGDVIRKELLTSLSSSQTNESQVGETDDMEEALFQHEDDENKEEIMPTLEQVKDAEKVMRNVRDYLPQLMSAVLKSPKAFDTNLADPIQKLQQLVLSRCSDDPNWGIGLCWLLEAVVGREWKALFENQQQTRNRFIVVLPAEMVAVAARVSSERQEAFKLLQHAEQATGYGDAPFYNHYQTRQQRKQQRHPQEFYYSETVPPRLPLSLRKLRHSHFGDTMHFVDSLTQISLDLREVPEIDRHSCLQRSLQEMNRRLRRRMVSRGSINLNVEDGCGPDDWPNIKDLSADMLKYSIRFPLEPKQHDRWPRGPTVVDSGNGGVVRVLNIVVDESYVLSSRERCPYLVRLEVAETGLRRNDARLYAFGFPPLGTTIQEALGMSATTSQQQYNQNKGSTIYRLPQELLDDTTFSIAAAAAMKAQERKQDENVSLPHVLSASGGWQADDGVYHPEHHHYSKPYDEVQQNEHEMLFHQLNARSDMVVQQPPKTTHEGEALLDKIFGKPWIEKCEEIRQASPFGKVEGWRLASFIMKAGEDIRREALVMQIITKMIEWFEADIPEPLRPDMRPYTIMCVGVDAGIVECLSDAKSIDEVKKRTDSFVSLRDFFERAYGPPVGNNNNNNNPHRYHHHYLPKLHTNKHPSRRCVTFDEAQDNFLRSLVGYSLVCYVLQIKDRHNANILLDRDGRIMHIDFGFVLGDTPKMGAVPIFRENAPFKLSSEFWDVLGGWHVQSGGLGVKFCRMFEHAFACASKHVEEIVSMVESTLLLLDHTPGQARIIAHGVRQRLQMRGTAESKEQKTFIIGLINSALTSWGTSSYDWLQKSMNGYR